MKTGIDFREAAIKNNIHCNWDEVAGLYNLIMKDEALIKEYNALWHFE